MVALPFFRPFTTPLEVTEATFLLEVFHFTDALAVIGLFATFSVVFLPFFTVTLRLVIACSFFSAPYFCYQLCGTRIRYQNTQRNVALPAFLPLIVSFPFLTDTIATLELLLFADLILSPLIAVVLILIAVVDFFT